MAIYAAQSEKRSQSEEVGAGSFSGVRDDLVAENTDGGTAGDEE